MATFLVDVGFQGQDAGALRQARNWFEDVFRPFRVLVTAKREQTGTRCFGELPKDHTEVLLRERTTSQPLMWVTRRGKVLDVGLHILERAGSDLLSFFERAEELISNYVVTHLQRHLWIHAAALYKNSSLVLLIAPSGMGKTTLSLALLDRGYVLATDDVTLFDLEMGQLMPFPRCPRIRGNALGALRNSGFHLLERATLRGRYVVLPARHLHLAPIDCPVRGVHVFFLTREHAGVSAGVQPLTLSETIRLLAKQSNVLAQDPQLEFITTMLRHASVYRLDLGAFDDTLERIMEVTPQ
ncbi:MAG TPA: hypothetical protein VJ673_08965 [Aromatoleum sp.]|uniref:hypothetical protein n=1 Tax=Aromatoleum sp. TaxID=2307007 RepID=UPI002B48932C|nr:hypothetical protein [Aromatoleum sp.]HJV25807.1 hypothetical protein [Aromatoleum sp.]